MCVRGRKNMSKNPQTPQHKVRKDIGGVCIQTKFDFDINSSKTRKRFLSQSTETRTYEKQQTAIESWHFQNETVPCFV